MTTSSLAASIRKGVARPVRRVARAFGFDVVSRRSSQRQADATWGARITLARDLGFTPNAILDGGAYRGLWARTASTIFPGAQLVLVEPNPHLGDTIAANIAGIAPKPIVVGAALGDRPGRATLNIWRDAGADSGASLLPNVAGPARLTVDVDVDTIDDIATRLGVRPGLVKLDLQGGELAALNGAASVLADAEVVVIEFGLLDAYTGRATPRDLLDVMYDKAFVLWDVVDLHYRPYDGSLTGGDFIFVKSASPLRAHKGWA